MKKRTLLLTIFIFVACSIVLPQNNLRKGIDSICVKYVPVSSESLCTATLMFPDDKSVVVLTGETNMPEAKSEILSYLEKHDVKVIDFMSLLPDKSVGEKKWGLVTLSICNLREKPSEPSELISQALMGTPVKILKRGNGWDLIQTPDSYIGWADDDAISFFTDKEINNWKNSDRIIYLKKWGDISDNIGEGIISDVLFGAIMKTTGQDKNYYKVTLPDGREGKIKKTDAVDFKQWAERNNVTADEMVKFGRTLLGTQYLWGGISAKGIDCSGLARACYYSAGTIITRDASSQFLYGTPVDISSSLNALQPGDLLFFGRVSDGKKVITHVGMYIGNTEFIHSSGRVKINSLDPSHENYSETLKKKLQGAKRFLGLPSGKGMVSVREHTWYF